METDRGRRFWARLVAWADAPVDPASLAAFRVLFGVVMAASAIRFLALGWVRELYVLPSFHFTWVLFPWVRPLPGPLMHAHFVALAVLACAVALGFHYRIATALFFLGFTYVELIDKTTYLNHYYLVTLLSGLLIVLPAHRAWSIDAWRRPALAAPYVPAWTVHLLRFQVAVVYIFAGLAKLNRDWILEAQPLRIWLAARSDVPLVGDLLAQPWLAYAFSWTGAVYDLTIVWLLLNRRTRLAAYATVIVFHALTALLFPIGMFPWIMIAVTSIFFPPDWPRRWFRRTAVTAPSAAPGLSRSMVIAVAVYVVIQITVPLRAYWPGTQPEWTYRGFNFAWRVMLIEKAGHTELYVIDRVEGDAGRRRPVRLRDYVTERQELMMAQDPFMVRALARHVAADLRAHGMPTVSIHAESFAALNGHPVQRLIDPTIDLVARSTRDWILPFRSDPDDNVGLVDPPVPLAREMR